MDISSIPILKQETIIKALQLGGLGVIILDHDSVIEWMSDDAIALFGVDRNTKRGGLKWDDLIQIDGESVWSEELETEYINNGFLSIEGYCDSPIKGRVALDLVMYRDPSSMERFVIIRDITALKLHEDELEVERSNAEQLNLALETEIQKANELAVMAERANIAKSVFLTSMSHEFRTPLNGVLGYSQILLKDKTLTDENHKAARTIEKCGRHLLSIINDVLDLSKVEAGKVDVQNEPVNITTLVGDVVDVFKVRAQGKGISLDSEFDRSAGEFEWIQGDSKLIRQILINLIGNAIKFTEQGGVRLVLRNLGHTGIGKCSKIRFSIIDTGAGIKKDDLKQVFEEFYQTEAFSGHKGGTGLGLAISRKLVAAMGGTLQLKSVFGEGSEFFFDLETEFVHLESDKSDNHHQTPHFHAITDSVPYYQLFQEDIDDGVILRVMGDHGCQCEVLSSEDDKETFLKLVDESKGTAFIGISQVQLNNPDFENTYERLKNSRTDLGWIIYQNGPQNGDEDRFSSIEKGRCIDVGSPFDLESFEHNLFHSFPDLWIADSETIEKTESVVESKNVSELNEAIPGPEIIHSMIFDAQIGDMRAFSSKLKEWEGDLGEATKFGIETTKLVDSFKIDELCKFLTELL